MNNGPQKAPQNLDYRKNLPLKPFRDTFLFIVDVKLYTEAWSVASRLYVMKENVNDVISDTLNEVRKKLYKFIH